MTARGPEPRWLSARDTADYISVRVGDLSRLVKQDRLPAPSYLLGPKQPRWDRVAVDAGFIGQAGQEDVGAAVEKIVQGILSAPGKRHLARKSRLDGDDAG